MKQLLALIALSAAATLSLAQTAAPAPADKPAFMSECLKK